MLLTYADRGITITVMIRNNNTNEKETKMLNTHEIVASKMKAGLTNQSEQIAEISNVLAAMGKSRTERVWLLSHDEDFISDVLGCLDK